MSEEPLTAKKWIVEIRQLVMQSSRDITEMKNERRLIRQAVIGNGSAEGYKPDSLETWWDRLGTVDIRGRFANRPSPTLANPRQPRMIAILS